MYVSSNSAHSYPSGINIVSSWSKLYSHNFLMMEPHCKNPEYAPASSLHMAVSAAALVFSVMVQESNMHAQCQIINRMHIHITECTLAWSNPSSQLLMSKGYLSVGRDLGEDILRIWQGTLPLCTRHWHLSLSSPFMPDSLALPGPFFLMRALEKGLSTRAETIILCPREV